MNKQAAPCVKSFNISRHLPGRGGGGSTERWRAAGAGLVCGTAAHHREALSATVVNLARCARLTLSQLHLGMQAGTGAQSTFEADGRPPEPHLWRPLASRMSHEEGGRTPRRHTHIYCILGHLATLCRTKVRFSLCTPRDRLLVKVPRCRAYPLQVFGGRFISTVITFQVKLFASLGRGGPSCDLWVEALAPFRRSGASGHVESCPGCCPTCSRPSQA